MAFVYVNHSFNWQALHGDQIELFEGFTHYRLPGHTPALLAFRLDLANAGTFKLKHEGCPGLSAATVEQRGKGSRRETRSIRLM